MKLNDTRSFAGVEGLRVKRQRDQASNPCSHAEGGSPDLRPEEAGAFHVHDGRVGQKR